MRDLAESLQVAHTSPLFEGPQSAFCVTVYNEPLAALKMTLLSIADSVAAQGVADAAGVTSCLCIVIDGAEAAQPEVLDWLGRNGFLGREPTLEVAGEAIHLSTHPMSELRVGFGAPDRPGEAALTVGVAVCVKRQNQGKLHSHFLFFRHICTWLRPTYCLQIDVGTIVDAGAYGALVSRMEDDPEIGALAPCITTTVPNQGSPFISTWQYFDFVLQKALAWPCEVALGYLSVMPGQFCVFRWSALLASDGGGGEAAPIDGYLRGLTTTDPLERVMYLAEDRVIGNEIVLAPGTKWKLKYCPEARAVTDACGTLPELMRQRRRWNNSAFACRLWVFARLPHYLIRADRGLGQKSQFLLAMLSQLVFLLLDFGAPALTVAVLAAFFAAFQAEGSVLVDVAKIAACAGSAGILLLPWAGRLARGPTSRRILEAFRAGISVTASIAMGIVLCGQLSAGALALLLAQALFAILAVAVLDWRLLPRMLISGHVFFLANIALSPLLATYSVFNLQDVSWGTKGLTSSSSSTAVGLARGMGRLKAAVVAMWLAFNAALIALALRAPGITSAKLSILFEISCLAGAIAAAISLAYLCRLRAGRRLRQAHASAAGTAWTRKLAATS